MLLAYRMQYLLACPTILCCVQLEAFRAKRGKSKAPAAAPASSEAPATAASEAIPAAAPAADTLALDARTQLQTQAHAPAEPQPDDFFDQLGNTAPRAIPQSQQPAVSPEQSWPGRWSGAHVGMHGMHASPKRMPGPPQAAANDASPGWPADSLTDAPSWLTDTPQPTADTPATVSVVRAAAPRAASSHTPSAPHAAVPQAASTSLPAPQLAALNTGTGTGVEQTDHEPAHSHANNRHASVRSSSEYQGWLAPAITHEAHAQAPAPSPSQAQAMGASKAGVLEASESAGSNVAQPHDIPAMRAPTFGGRDSDAAHALHAVAEPSAGTHAPTNAGALEECKSAAIFATPQRQPDQDSLGRTSVGPPLALHTDVPSKGHAEVSSSSSSAPHHSQQAGAELDAGAPALNAGLLQSPSAASKDAISLSSAASRHSLGEHAAALPRQPAWQPRHMQASTERVQAPQLPAWQYAPPPALGVPAPAAGQEPLQPAAEPALQQAPALPAQQAHQQRPNHRASEQDHGAPATPRRHAQAAQDGALVPPGSAADVSAAARQSPQRMRRFAPAAKWLMSGAGRAAKFFAGEDGPDDRPVDADGTAAVDVQVAERTNAANGIAQASAQAVAAAAPEPAHTPTPQPACQHAELAEPSRATLGAVVPSAGASPPERARQQQEPPVTLPAVAPDGSRQQAKVPVASSQEEAGPSGLSAADEVAALLGPAPPMLPRSSQPASQSSNASARVARAPWDGAAASPRDVSKRLQPLQHSSMVAQHKAPVLGSISLASPTGTSTVHEPLPATIAGVAAAAASAQAFDSFMQPARSSAKPASVASSPPADTALSHSNAAQQSANGQLSSPLRPMPGGLSAHAGSTPSGRALHAGTPARSDHVASTLGDVPSADIRQLASVAAPALPAIRTGAPSERASAAEPMPSHRPAAATPVEPGLPAGAHASPAALTFTPAVADAQGAAASASGDASGSGMAVAGPPRPPASAAAQLTGCEAWLLRPRTTDTHAAPAPLRLALHGAAPPCSVDIDEERCCMRQHLDASFTSSAHSKPPAMQAAVCNHVCRQPPRGRHRALPAAAIAV